jgi:hypothetical protein
LAEIRGYNANVKGRIDKYVGDAIGHVLSFDNRLILSAERIPSKAIVDGNSFIPS